MTPWWQWLEETVTGYGFVDQSQFVDGKLQKFLDSCVNECQNCAHISFILYSLCVFGVIFSISFSVSA